MSNLDPRAEMLRLVELDYERTNQFVQGVLATGVTIKGWAITISLALLGVSFDRKEPGLGVLAIIVTFTFALVDAYHSWLYAQALAHSQRIERILRRYHASLARGSADEDVTEDFEVELEAFDFGLSASLQKFRWSSLRFARPRFVLLMLYGGLLVVEVVATLIVAGISLIAL